MANSNYSQVIDLLAANRLNWRSDMIYGYLCADAVFDADHKVLTDVGTSVVSKALIQGRILDEGGLFLGYPAFFESVPEGTYQVLLVQDQGLGQINLLAFYDTSGVEDPLTMDHDGTFVLRPDPAEGFDASTRVWMQV